MTGVISVGAFIRNRLDITNIRNVVGSFIRVILMLLLFGLFVPHLWYIGLTVIVMDVYIIGSNYYFYRLLTPELHVKWKYFDFKYVKGGHCGRCMESYFPFERDAVKRI